MRKLKDEEEKSLKLFGINIVGLSPGVKLMSFLAIIAVFGVFLSYLLSKVMTKNNPSKKKK